LPALTRRSSRTRAAIAATGKPGATTLAIHGELLAAAAGLTATACPASTASIGLTAPGAAGAKTAATFGAAIAATGLGKTAKAFGASLASTRATPSGKLAARAPRSGGRAVGIGGLDPPGRRRSGSCRGGGRGGVIGGGQVGLGRH